MAEHTPKWELMKVGPTWTICEGTNPVADLYRGIDTTQDEVDGKARLIAAAPALLEALNEIATTPVGDSVKAKTLQKIAEAAIRLAGGE